MSYNTFQGGASIYGEPDGSLVINSTNNVFAGGGAITFDGGASISGNPDGSLEIDSTNITLNGGASISGNPDGSLQIDSTNLSLNGEASLTGNTDGSLSINATSVIMNGGGSIFGNTDGSITIESNGLKYVPTGAIPPPANSIGSIITLPFDDFVASGSNANVLPDQVEADSNTDVTLTVGTYVFSSNMLINFSGAQGLAVTFGASIPSTAQGYIATIGGLYTTGATLTGYSNAGNFFLAPSFIVVVLQPIVVFNFNLFYNSLDGSSGAFITGSSSFSLIKIS